MKRINSCTVQLYSLGFFIGIWKLQVKQANFVDELKAVSLSPLKTYKQVVKRHAYSV